MFYCVAVSLLAVVASSLSDVPIYKQASQPVAARVADLLSRMTLQEKVNQLLNPVGQTDGPGNFNVNVSNILANYGSTGLGTVYTGIGGCPNHTYGWACQNFLQSSIIASSRLGIPVSVIGETLVSGTGGGTIFPQPVLRGCSFNVALESAIGLSIARQARIGGIDRGLSPVLQVDTDVRFGRFEESYGEDAFLVSTMGVAVALSLQGGAEGPNEYVPDNTKYVSCESKHALSYGFGGRDWYATDISNQTLFDVYGKPWHRYIRRAGGRGLMVAHPAVNGLPLHGNRFILTDVLRDWYGNGEGSNNTGDYLLIASDWGNVNGITSYGVAADQDHAAMLATWSGMDNTMQPPPSCISTLVNTTAAGLINMSYIDRAAGNNLREKFATGLFDGYWQINGSAYETQLDLPEDRALAYQSASEGIVLLKNDAAAPAAGGAPLLPLAGLGSSIKSVAVLGPLAGCVPGESYPCLAQQGMGGHYTQYGARIVTMVDAVGNASVKYGFTYSHVVGVNIDDYNLSGLAEAVAAAEAADLILVAVGDSIPIGKGSCSEMSDADTADLPGGQLNLLSAVAALGKPVITLLFNCRPATFGAGPFSAFGANNALLEALPAVVVGWRSGEEGANAVWDILEGSVAPSGRLTQNWVRTAAQVKSPVSPYTQYRGNPDNAYFTEPATPNFYFGHGLTYSNFTVSNVAVSPPSSGGQSYSAYDNITISGTLSSAGGGSISLLAFFNQNAPTKYVRYGKALCGFTKVAVPPGGAATPFSIVISVEDFGVFEQDTFDYEVFSGSYQITLATDADFSPFSNLAPDTKVILGGQDVFLTYGQDGTSPISQFNVQVQGAGTYNFTWDFTQ